MIDVTEQVSAVRREVGSRLLAAGQARVVTVSRTYRDEMGGPARLTRPGPRFPGGLSPKKKERATSLHFQSIAYPGACGKTRVVPQNSWPGQNLRKRGSRSA
jgi:hypothetical protein